MGRFFSNTPMEGKPLSLRGIARGLRRLEEAWEQLEIIGGHREWKFGSHVPRLIIDGLNAVEDYEEDYPFKVTDNGGGSISVKGGSWTRNGIKVTLADTTLSSVGADDYVYIYLESASGNDPSINPETLLVTQASAISETSDILRSGSGYNYICILGKFTGGVWEQYWKGGHIDDIVLRPDGDKFDTTGRSTIIRNPESGKNAGELQVGDVHDVKASALSVPFFSSNDTIPKQGAISWAALDAHELATPTHKSIEIVGTATGTAYAQISGFRAPATPTDPFATDSYNHHFCLRETNGTLTVVTWYDFDTFVSGLETKVKADLLDDSEWLDDLESALDISSTHTGLDFSGSTSAKGVGLSGGNTDHDDSYWHEAGDITGAYFTDTKNYVTSGEVWANALKLQGSETTNLWTDDAFGVLVSAVVSIGASSESANLFLGLTGYEFSAIYFNGVAGVSVTNWTTKGGLTGTDIIEVSADEIQPTDKVLVRRA